MMKLVAALAVLAVLAGCGPPPAPAAPDAVAIARAVTLKPSNARLAGLYAQSCFACHTNLDSGAPLTGHVAAWKPRLKKGMPALVQSTVGGLNGMPAGGQCFACSAADYEALIKFMAEGEG